MPMALKSQNGVYYAKLKIKREGEKDITEILKMMKLR